MSELTNLTNCSETAEKQMLWCEDHQEGVIVWACFGVVTSVFGFPAAVAVLWDILQRRRKGDQITPYDIFVFNASIIDGICLLFTIPEVYNFLHGHNMNFETFLIFLFPLVLCGRPLFSTCICVDCYLAVVHPVVYHANKSLTPRVLTAVVVWIGTLLYGCIFLASPVFIDTPFQVIFFALTLPIIGFCDVTIFWTLKRSNPTGGSVHPQKKKALQVITNNLVITFTSSLPPVIGVLVAKLLNTDNGITFCVVMLPVLCSTLVGNTVTPILYLSNLGKLDWLKWFWQR